MFTSSFKDLFKAFGPDRPKSPMLSREERLTRSMPPVVVEMLEQRRLLSYSIEVNGATMEITGSVNGDTISVSMSAGSIYVTDIVAGTSSGYNPNPISLIKIVAGAGADSIFINKNDAASTAIVDPCLIYGDAGNDTIDSGNYGDTVYGGDGNDSIFTWMRDDLVYAGAGFDTVSGGDDNDTLRGEADSDEIDGNDGNDLIYGGDGNDDLDGWDGNDLLYGDNGDDVLADGNGADTIYGGFGSDTVNPQSDADTDRFYGGADSDVLNAGHSGSDWWGEFELVN